MPKISALGGMSSRGFGEFAQSTAATYIEDVFSTYLYNGTGASQTITNGIDLSGKGGLVWLKSRSQATQHLLLDTARGFSTGNQNVLNSSSTAPASNDGPGTTSVIQNGTASGFVLGTGSGFAASNQSTQTYASWTFRKQPKFFDVVTWTGDGTNNRVINHNLGSTPGMIIIKCFDTASNWNVYHRSIPSDIIFLERTDAAVNGGGFYVTATTTTTFTIGRPGGGNATGQQYVAYLFAHDAGGFGADGSQNVISCGSFTTDASGNASVTLGYEPQYLLLKCSSASQNWFEQDIMCGWNQTQWNRLLPNLSNAEVQVSGNYAYPTSTGCVFTGSQLSSNATYIYMAIRRGPMRTPTSGTSVFYPLNRTGTGGSATLTGAAFPPDWYLSKATNQSTYNPIEYDRLRGYVYLLTSSTGAEGAPGGVTSFNMNGVSVTGGSSFGLDGSGDSIINYFFGRAPGFFDVVCYTGTGSAATINHNLGVVPEMIIVKGRNAVTDWPTYHTGLNGGVTPEQWYVRVNSTTAQTNAVANWNNTTPTSTVFSVGGNNIGSGTTFVAYLFATCPGVSKVGSYTGTGATQTISCGFTGGARFVLIKRADGVASWWVWDTARGMVAGTDPRLALNFTNAEANANWVYTTTGGFQIVTSDTSINASGGTYIYLAIA